MKVPGLLFLLQCACLCVHGSAPATGALIGAGQVHDLPPAMAAQHVPVHLVATVTYYEPGTRTLFVEDRTGAVYVRTRHDYHLQRGDLVEIQGSTAKSFRTTIATDPQIHLLRHGVPPRPAQVTRRAYQQIIAGKWDCRYISVQGTVRSALWEPQGNTSVLELEVMLPGGLVQVYVPQYHGVAAGELAGSEVRVAGVVGANFNAKWQMMQSVLYAEDTRDVSVLHSPRVTGAQLPYTPIDDVVQTRDVLDRSQWVKVHGVVTFYRPGHSVVIGQDGHSLFAATRETRPIPLGSVVDLLGFAEDSGYSPALGQSQIVLTGETRPLHARAVSYAQAVSGSFSDDLISIEGRVLSEVHTEAADTLSLVVDGHPVTVELQGPAGVGPLPVLLPGSMVAVVGICRITTSNAWGEPGVTPMLFRVDMRSPADVQILKPASWWTVQHLSCVLGCLLAISVGITAWAITLRRRVAHQNTRIARTVGLEKHRSRLLESISSDAELESILQEICRFVDRFGSGLHCCCVVAPSNGRADVKHRSVTMGDLPAPVLYRKSLFGRDGKSVGLFSAGSREDEMGALTDEQAEVASIAVELAALAVSQRRLYEDLNYTSSHDGLTGLPNRRTADADLEQAIERAVLHGIRVGVAYIDIDHFKQVNDLHGHKCGDLYLQQIATRLRASVRGTDCLARIGGDEFLLVAPHLCGREELDTLRTRLESCFREQFLLEGASVLGSASIGLAIYPDHGMTAAELKRHADADMYAAKQRRKLEAAEAGSPPANGLFTPAAIVAALSAGHFRLHYQPQFSPGGHLRGLEALLRLHDPVLGLVMPGAFILTAEQSGLMRPLGAWVLEQALSDAKRWRLSDHTGARVIVNSSPQEVEDPSFADGVLQALDAAGLPPSILEIEITERSLIGDLQQANQQLKRLQTAGVQIAVDDFGVEYSSLNSLHLLPVDTLKIDRSFIRAISVEPGVLPIIKMIVALAHSMQKRVVAEGVGNTG